MGWLAIANNVCRVTTWPALENVTELCDMTRFLQTLDMCAFRANVTRLLFVCLGTHFYALRRVLQLFFPGGGVICLSVKA
jgi:hypothetical protein